MHVIYHTDNWKKPNKMGTNIDWIEEIRKLIHGSIREVKDGPCSE
jgi:hypothetical protein